MITRRLSEISSLAARGLRAALGTTVALAAAGCEGTAGGDAVTSMDGKALIVVQGKSMQGKSMQGTSLQGLSLQSLTVDVVSLLKKSKLAVSAQGITLQGATLLSGTRALTAGTIFTATDGSGAQTSLRIAQVQSDWQDASGETTLYAVEAQGDGGTWANICDPDPWGERWAIPMSGSWDETGARVEDPTRFTLACTSGVIAKCVRWGYKPWRTVHDKSLAPYHQTCTRMARADYCGTGVSHTVDGTLIDLYDELGLQTRTTDPSLYFEAAWSPSGAVCIAHARWFGATPTNPTKSMLQDLLEDCSKRGVHLSYDDLGSGDICYVARNDLTRADILMRDRSAFNTTWTQPQ